MNADFIVDRNTLERCVYNLGYSWKKIDTFSSDDLHQILWYEGTFNDSYND